LLSHLIAEAKQSSGAKASAAPFVFSSMNVKSDRADVASLQFKLTGWLCIMSSNGLAPVNGWFPFCEFPHRFD